MKKIAIFVSGSGSNAQNIIEYFRKKNTGKIVCIFCNKPDAYVITRAKNFQIPVHLFDRPTFYNSDQVTRQLLQLNIDLIVLAGFMWLIPESLIAAFNNRIINIHPALLPKYGGKGMYGDNVHKAVVANHETETGITIHLVNNEYDKGEILFQAKTSIQKDATAEEVAASVHQLEYRFYPQVIEQYLLKLV